MRNDELAAAQAYIRLLEATRAALTEPGEVPVHVPLLTSPIAEADVALERAGLCGNESRFFDLVRSLQPSMSGSGR
ncbi:hypothetical protein OG369_36825 [Streptomyces sp. NBC_01221]|uniref:hypothetical protein n=1 Tax=Streptomyces sp. NBC_01221 TaxID=2903782 RepID=UPI00225A897E|nr:hypothetical protein [Streptomyces sp. NBC_01221]MCX4791486.1 hypothetical protein [Streptomyces sp. NBC_01221]